MIINRVLLIVIFLFSGLCLLKAQEELTFPQFDNTVDSLGKIVLEDTLPAIRDRSVSQIMLLFQHYLTDSASFNQPFKSLKTMSVLYPLDSSFRIITGQHFINNNEYRYFGGIQLASGRFIPLHDQSYEIRKAEEDYTLLDKDKWYGALYYRIFDCELNGEKYYLLLGFNSFSFYNKRKVIDILSFDKNKNPIFGKEVFKADTGEVEDYDLRKLYMYSADVSQKLNFDSTLGFIVLDHLIPSKEIFPGQGPTFVPDGSLEGYRYENGRWQHINVLEQKAMDDIMVAPAPPSNGEEQQRYDRLYKAHRKRKH